MSTYKELRKKELDRNADYGFNTVKEFARWFHYEEPILNKEFPSMLCAPSWTAIREDEVSFQFGGWEVVLRDNGTWVLVDTTGC